MMVRRGSCRASPRHCVSGRAPRRSRCVGARAVVAVQPALADIAARSAGVSGASTWKVCACALRTNARRCRRAPSADGVCGGDGVPARGATRAASRTDPERSACARAATNAGRSRFSAGTAVRRWRWSDRGARGARAAAARSAGARRARQGLPAPGSRLPAPGSRLPAPGSRLPAPGSRLPAPGSRLPAPGSRLPAPGSRLPAPGSRLPAPGSRLPAPGSRLPAPGSRLPAPGSRLPAPGSRLPAPGSRLPAPGSRLNFICSYNHLH